MGFMQSLAAEVGEHKIKLSTILPGSILTDFGGRSVAEKQEAIAAGKRVRSEHSRSRSFRVLLKPSFS